MRKVIRAVRARPIDVIKLLKEDHRKVEQLFESFEKARTKLQKQKLINQIVEELAVHATAEEKHVYPVLAESEEDMSKEAIEEHHVVKLVLAELADFDGSEENVDAKVKVLSELVQHHVEEEEKELFPKLKESGADLTKMAELVLAEKEKLQSKMKKVGDKSKRQIGGGPAKRRLAS